MSFAVFDASALAAGLIDSAEVGSSARTALVTLEPMGPELVLAETANVLRRAARLGTISEDHASMAYRDLMQIHIELFPFSPFADRIWALHENLTIYDAWYVALAEYLGCPLLTFDERLARAPDVRCEVVMPSSP
jgi:predicted nucleic acid-binding protein